MLRVIKDAGEEKTKIRKTLENLAEYYNVKLSDNQLDMYTEDLIEMGSDTVTKAASDYRKEWYSKSFPLPAQLRKQVLFGVNHRNALLKF